MIRLKSLLNELTFATQAAFDKYNSAHKLRNSTVVTIAGKKTTAGQAEKKTEKKKKEKPVSSNSNGAEYAEDDKYWKDAFKPGDKIKDGDVLDDTDYNTYRLGKIGSTLTDWFEEKPQFDYNFTPNPENGAMTVESGEDSPYKLVMYSPNDDGNFIFGFADSESSEFTYDDGLDSGYVGGRNGIEDPQFVYQSMRYILAQPETAKFLKGEMKPSEYKPLYDRMKSQLMSDLSPKKENTMKLGSILSEITDDALMNKTIKYKDESGKEKEVLVKTALSPAYQNAKNPGMQTAYRTAKQMVDKMHQYGAKGGPGSGRRPAAEPEKQRGTSGPKTDAEFKWMLANRDRISNSLKKKYPDMDDKEFNKKVTDVMKATWAGRQDTPNRQKEDPSKLSGSDLTTSAEKKKDKSGAMKGGPGSGRTSTDLPMLRDLMPNANFDRKPLSAIAPIERQQISTIIDKLAELGKQARERGENAPNFNLCQVSVPGTNLYCDGNKGIPREDMPQFKGTPEPGSSADKLPKDKNGEVDTEEFFKKMLEKQGIKVSEPAAIKPDRLKATQSELVGTKVAGMEKALEENPQHPAITAPIYVSNDGYVLDGHHRWAAIVAYNAAHPDKPIPMQVRVIDEPIEPLVKRSNEFAEKIGIKPKAADTGAAGGPSPMAPEKKKSLDKRVSSEGEELSTIQTKNGSTLFGVAHDDIKGAKDIVKQVKDTYSSNDKIVFMGEGGDSNNVYPGGSEQEYIYKQLGKSFPNMQNDSWDGKEFDVMNPQAEMFSQIGKDTKQPPHIVNAGIFAAMVGQGQDPQELAKLADDKTIQYLKSNGISDPMNPSDEDVEMMYDLTFPQDKGLPPTDLSKTTDSYNKLRQRNLIHKMNIYEKKGYKVISLAGNSHVEELNA